MTILPTGNVLAFGGGTVRDGIDPTKAVYAAEEWDPATETWTTVASMATPRLYHSTSLLLPDGRVLMAGGGRNYLNNADFPSAEIYSPSYLFKGARPTITSAPPLAKYGSQMLVQTPDGANIASVALVRPGSVTHNVDMDQRYVPLAFQQTAGGLTVQAPADANLAPPGNYMLFIVDANGVPSVASFVRFPAGYEDDVAPSAPSDLNATGGVGAASLAWSAATDNVRVAGYNVYRSTTSGFFASDATKIGTSTTTSYMDTGAAPGTYYYLVTAVDPGGNVGPASNEASAVVVADTTAPAVSVTAPPTGATVANAVTLSAAASDDVGVAGVKFFVDGAQVGAEDTAAPYALSWNSRAVANGQHVITAVARDAAGNATTSAGVTVDVQNAGPEGLVAAWGFDEGSGTTAGDATGNGHSGAIFNATWATGKFGGALSFNGVDAWVTVADAADLHLASGMTLEAWVRPSEVSGFETVILKERGSSGLSYALYANDSDRGNAPAGYLRTGVGGDRGVPGDATLPVDAWSHLATTYDGSAFRMYVNGTLVGTLSASGEILTTDDVLRIGGNGVWDGEFFTGLIDEVRVYNRALTAEEILSDSQTPVNSAAAPRTSVASVQSAAYPTGTFSDGTVDGTADSDESLIRVLTGNQPLL
jgi:hypothetical protein